MRPIFLGIVIGTVLYAPISIYVFGNGIDVIIDRLYFMLAGALCCWVGMANTGRETTP